jgi:hypothetical protein
VKYDENREINKLIEKYPDIFQDADKPASKTCMCWGITCRDGWKDTLDEACKQLTHLKEVTGIQVIADQVKEKFAGLRFYAHLDKSGYKLADEDLDSWCEIVENVVSKSMEKCECLCEECGERRYETHNVGYRVWGICKDCLDIKVKERGEEFEEQYYKDAEFYKKLAWDADVAAHQYKEEKIKAYNNGEEVEFEFSDAKSIIFNLRDENVKKTIKINELENKLGD